MPEAGESAPKTERPDDEGGGLADAFRRIVDELAKRGEVRTKDITQAARDIAERSARNRDETVRLISKEIRRQLASRGPKKTDTDPDT